MKRLLYQIHRWAGIVLALFMFIWFASGLVIMYASPSALTPAQQLANRESLNPEAGWLSLGQSWQASAAQRAAQAKEAPREDKPEGIQAKEPESIGNKDWLAQARLVRLAHQPYWLIETGAGKRLALSALDGNLHAFSAKEAEQIGTRWVEQDPFSRSDAITLRYIDTGPQDSSVRNQEALRPFHRFKVGDTGRELLISTRTGEVVRDTTALERTLYWVGNWIHLLRPLDSIGLGKQRSTIQAWLGAGAFAAALTGLIIGWQRWRPGWGGRATYSQGRKHPYRDVWNTWHFWVGLIGGTAALLWALSGYLSTNPFQIFSPANPTKDELRRFQGSLASEAMLNWRPVPLAIQARSQEIVELAWHRLDQDVALLGVTRDGEHYPQAVPGTVADFNGQALLRAAARFAGATQIAGQTLVTEYDSYYYPRHRQSEVDRPLPVVRVDLADSAGTRLYIDPQDGQLLLKQDASRRVYRWLYSALHHWDLAGSTCAPCGTCGCCPSCSWAWCWAARPSCWATSA